MGGTDTPPREPERYPSANGGVNLAVKVGHNRNRDGAS